MCPEKSSRLCCFTTHLHPSHPDMMLSMQWAIEGGWGVAVKELVLQGGFMGVNLCPPLAQHQAEANSIHPAPLALPGMGRSMSNSYLFTISPKMMFFGPGRSFVQWHISAGPDVIASRKSLQQDIYLSGLPGGCRCSECCNCHSVSSPRDSPAAVPFATTPMVMTNVISITYVGIIISPHFLIHQFLDEFCKRKWNVKESDQCSASERLCVSCHPDPGWASPLATTLLGTWGSAAASLCSSGCDAAQKQQKKCPHSYF